MWQCRERLYRCEHRIEGDIFWLASSPERCARLPLKREFVRDMIVVFVHGFVVRECEK